MSTRGILVGFVFLPLLAGAQVLDQQHSSGAVDGWILEQSQSLAQSFTPSMSGNLVGVDLNLARNLARSGTLTLQIRELEQQGALGTPSTFGPALFSNDYSFDLMGANFGFVHFAMDGGPALAANQPYVMILQTDHPDPLNGGLDPAAWTFGASGQYTGGFALVRRFLASDTGWIASPTVDLDFRTYMVAVPEPSTVGLALGGGIFALVAWRSRRQRA
jgi:hypothetical protein